MRAQYDLKGGACGRLYLDTQLMPAGVQYEESGTTLRAICALSLSTYARALLYYTMAHLS